MPYRSSLCGAVLLAIACAGGEERPATTAATLAGSYHTDTLATADGSSRIFTLELKGGGDATLSAAYSGGTNESRSGTWTEDGPNLTLVLSEPAETLGFRKISDRLVPVTWDRERYGEAGITLNHF